MPEGTICCPRCGIALPIAFDDPDAFEDPEEFGEFEEPDDDMDWDSDDEEIDDPELLALAEAYVRRLPLTGQARADGLVEVTEGYARRPATEEPAAEEPENLVAEEPEPGGECSSCGRQSQRGWAKCPWCGTRLPS